MLSLDYDTLVHIFELLRPRQGLRALSVTSHSIREACKPTLFRECGCRLRVPLSNRGQIVPTAIQGYVRNLYIVDSCPDKISLYGNTPDKPPRYTDNRMLCGLFNDRFLHCLEGLPALETLTITQGQAEHGLSWSTIKRILSLPRMRTLNLQNLYFCPVWRDTDRDRALATPLPLTSFTLQNIRESPLLELPPEREALSIMLHSGCNTLEVLQLPPECTPIQTLTQLSWPRLREFTLCGELKVPQPALISSLSAMACLRSLALRFRLGMDVTEEDIPRIWPASLSVASFPWPALERLVVAPPHSEDQLYEHLPSSLRYLALCYWPHEYTLSLKLDINPYYPSRMDLVIRPKGLLQIFERCRLPLLTRLMLEYAVDEEEEQMLRRIAVSFPSLARLNLLRYDRRRPVASSEADVAMIARSLATLTQLESLRITMEFRDGPQMLCRVPGYGMGEIEVIPEGREYARKCCKNAVNVFAAVLSPSVKWVSVNQVAVPGACATAEVDRRRMVTIEQ